MAMLQPGAAPLNYSTALHHVTDRLVTAWPEKRWLKTAGVAASILAFGADVVISRHYARVRPESQADLQRRLADLYRHEADLAAGRPQVAQASAEAQAQSIVNVQVGLPPTEVHSPVGGQAPLHSRYLMEEGNADRDTDCFSCATAHFAGTEGALHRARFAAERDGECGPECQSWLHLAAQEPEALLGRDWTPERTARFPAEQRAMIDRLSPQLRDLQRGIVGGDPQRQAIVDAAWELKEASRFTATDDPLDHPEVDGRIRKAEEDLVVGERLRVGAFDKDTATQIRRLRQAVGSDIVSHEKLVEVADRADDVSRAAAAPAYSRLTPEDIAQLERRAQTLRTQFIAERRRLAPVAAAQGLAMVGQIRPRRPSDAHIPRHVVEDFTLPSRKVAEEVTDRESIARHYDHLEQGIESRGVRVRYRNLPSTFDEVLFGLYNSDTNTILIDSFAKATRDPFAYQVLAHESTHALLDGPSCYDHAYEEGVEYSQQPSEVRAQAASLAAMVELGMPVELDDGTELPPGEREVDWQRLEATLGPDVTRDTKWAADWIVGASRGQPTVRVGEVCPARR